MRILVAPNKFKGSLGAGEVGACIAAGLRAVLPQAEIKITPIADGGEGTADVIRRAHEGEWFECRAHDALGREICARYAWLPESATAVLEMSAAVGWTHITPNERNPLLASTFGVGEMVRAAAARDAANRCRIRRKRDQRWRVRTGTRAWLSFSRCEGA